jgi:parafibromin
MTTGQTWQFKPYKWQDPTQLFHHGLVPFSGFRISLSYFGLVVKGIHVTWANDPPNPRVRDWNVTDLKVHKIRPLKDSKIPGYHLLAFYKD